MSLDTQIIYARYVEAVKGFKKMASSNKKLAITCEKLLYPSKMKLYANTLTKPSFDLDEDEEDDDDDQIEEIEEIKDPEENIIQRPKDITEISPDKPEHDFFREKRFPFSDIKNEGPRWEGDPLLRGINDKMKNRREYFDSSLTEDYDFDSHFKQSMDTNDLEKQYEVMSVMLFKHLNTIPEKVVASIVNSPYAYLPKYMNPSLYNIASELRPLCNERTINSTIDTIVDLKEGSNFNYKTLSDTSFVEVVDKIKNILVNENGIYFGDIDGLKRFIYDGSQSDKYIGKNKKVGETSEERFKQGFETLVKIIAAQQLCLKYGDIPSKVYKRDKDGNPIVGDDGKPLLVTKYQKRHEYNAPHPTEEISIDRDFSSHKDRWRTKEHMYKNPDEAYNPHRVMEYGVTKDEENLGFNDEDDPSYTDINLIDKKSIPPDLLTASNQVSEKLAGVINRMIEAPAGGSFKILYAFYAACKDRKGRLSGKNVEVMNVDADLLDLWGIPYDESRLREQEEWLHDQEEYVKKYYIPIRVSQPKAFQSLWRYYQKEGLDNQTKIDIKEISKQWQWVLKKANGQENRDKLARHMVNVLHEKLRPIYDKKTKELAEYRSKGMYSPFHKPSKNKMQDKDKDWLEAAVILTTLKNELPDVIVQDFIKYNLTAAGLHSE